MLRRWLCEWRERWAPGTILRISMGASVVLLTGILLLEFLVPVRMSVGTDVNLPGSEPDELPSISAEAIRPSPVPPAMFAVRPGLFKSTVAMQDKPMADKTMEKIRSQLKLQCVMHLNGEPVAYVNIKNLGVKKCRVGESVADLFTVVSIDSKSIEISIVDHHVTLGL